MHAPTQPRSIATLLQTSLVLGGVAALAFWPPREGAMMLVALDGRDFRLRWFTAAGACFAADLTRGAYAYDGAGGGGGKGAAAGGAGAGAGAGTGGAGSGSVWHYMERRAFYC